MYGRGLTAPTHGLRLGYGSTQHGTEGFLRDIWVRDLPDAVLVDSEDAPPEQFRMDVCASMTTDTIDQNDTGVVAKVIPTGRCAKLRHVGSDETLDAAIRFLYARRIH